MTDQDLNSTRTEKANPPPMFRFYALFLLVAVCVFCDDRIKFCSGPGAVMEIESLTIEPERIVLGQNITIRGVGELKKAITEGAVANISIYYDKFPFFKKTLDMCKEASDYGLPIQCPVAPRRQEIPTMSIEVPKIVPAGHYKGRVQGHLADGTGNHVC
ncbi:hypothetical protein GEMRC1_004239 [Eukaryota sp. GEM-RC1]